MRRIALTGGIATGKTHVVGRLRASGIPCLDADDLSHGVTAAGTEATAAIRARFGDGVIARDGAVDRKALGRVVFADPAARTELEAIVHPGVRRAIEAGLRGFELLDDRAPFAVVAIPLLYETGREGDFDAVISTTCTEAQQIERLLGRGLTRAEAEQRVRAQLPAADKAARADFVIDTGGRFEDTDRQVEEVVQKLRTKS